MTTLPTALVPSGRPRRPDAAWRATAVTSFEVLLASIF